MTTAANGSDIRLQALRYLLRPVIHFALRSTISVHALLDTVRELLLELAEDELRQSGGKVNDSRLSVMTGLYRQDIKRIRSRAKEPKAEPPSIIPRIINHWEQSPNFRSKSGDPRVLTYKGPESEFNRLAEAVSNNVHPAAVLFELERAGIVTRTARGLKLRQRERVVGTDALKTYELLGRDIASLIGGVEENINNFRYVGNLHLSTDYDNIYKDSVLDIRRWLINESRAFHKRVREFLAGHDKDITPDPNPHRAAGARVSLTFFGSTTPPSQELIDSDQK